MKIAILLATLMLIAGNALAQEEVKVNGKVTTIKGDTISLSTKSGPVDVITTAETTYQHVSGAEMKRDEITNGAFLLVTGLKSADGKVKASTIMIHPMMDHPPMGHGGTAQKNPHQMPPMPQSNAPTGM